MGIRAGAAFLVFVSLIVVVPVAGAAPPCRIDVGLIDFVPPLEETAEVIVVFRSSVDYPMVNGPRRSFRARSSGSRRGSAHRPS